MNCVPCSRCGSKQHVLTNVDCNAFDWGLLTFQEQRHILVAGKFLGAVRDDLAEYIFCGNADRASVAWEIEVVL